MRSHQKISSQPILWGLVAALGSGLVQAQSTDAPRPAKRPGIAAQQVVLSERVNLDPTELPRRTVARSLWSMGAKNGFSLHGTDSQEVVKFSVRKDEVVESAHLNVEYTFSPALLPQLSHLNVEINGEIVQTMALPQNQLGRPQSSLIPIDPRFFADYNELSFRFIGHYALECENPGHSTLWAKVSRETQLQLQLRQLQLRNELQQLPLPFFDPRDNRRVMADFVLPPQASLGILKASGTMAGWLGAKADYRGTLLQAHSDRLPDNHAIVFATAMQAPSFVAELASRVEVPTLQFISHPHNPAFKLLLVMGKDDVQLEQAAQALALGKVLLSGESTQVQDVVLPAPRKPYDAPRWHDTTRPIPFADLVSSAQDLQVQGYALNTAITTHMRLPPDLFAWNNKHVPVTLRYRYTPNEASAHGMVSLLLNERLLRSFPLESSTASERRLLPRFGHENDKLVQHKFYLPAEWIAANNRWDFQVQLPPQEQGRCLTTVPVEVRAALDPETSVDLTGLPHFIAMPNLKAYAEGGFPFSRLADLRETSFVLPAERSDHAVAAYLNTIAHISGVTGYPGTRFQIFTEHDLQRLPDTDLVVISDGTGSSVLRAWKQHLPALLEAGEQSITLSQKTLDRLSELWSLEKTEKLHAGHAIFNSSGPVAALTGFASPLHHDRSVIAWMANSPEALSLISENLSNSATAASFMGDLVLTNGKAIESYRVQSQYYVGKLSFIEGLWFHLHKYPIALAMLGIVIGLIFTFFGYASLRLMARRRLERAQ